MISAFGLMKDEKYGLGCLIFYVKCKKGGVAPHGILLTIPKIDHKWSVLSDLD